MIRIHCDNCERLIEVPDEQAGEKIACPDCGDINRVPGAAPDARRPGEAPAKKQDRAAAAGYPPDSGPEKTVRTLRPSLFRARPITFSVTALLLVAAIIALATGLAQGRAWLWVMGALVALVALAFILYWWVKTLSAALVVTNKRTIQKRGLLARSTSEVVHDNIRNIQIDQTFWQRVWGVGSIGISSSGQDGIEVQMGDLKNPDEIRRIIDLYRPL
ncbi:MAG: PH domain-containing protein [Phycisphaerales bacterium]